jgi:UDP-N-acetyl-D-glucosamine dehydrogenase
VKTTAQLRRRILAAEARVAVVAQGYVGLSLACAAADSGFPVTGIDENDDRIRDLEAGNLSVPGVAETEFRAGLATERLSFAAAFGPVAECDVVVICVPTPVREGSPDLSYVERAARSVSEHLRSGQLVILESTTYPGTTEGPVRLALERSGLVAGRDFLLAYSPERIDPGNQEYSLRTTPRIVGGMTPEATGMASLFYGQIVDKVITVGSPRAAELAKLLENTFRHVNIALVNEMAMLCHEMDIDVWEVIEATGSKPFGFMPFHPGPGVGGNCIPVDPAYLAWHVRRDAGHQFRTLEQAEDINSQMPRYAASRISDALNEAGKAVKNSRILVLGVAYKPDVAEAAESPALKVMSVLEKRGASVTFHDPFIESIRLGDSVRYRTELTQSTVGAADCVALLTPHRSYDLDWIADRARLVFDARNAYGQDSRENVVRL